jgi:5-methylcytosine-specific restriction endonuclease McrA
MHPEARQASSQKRRATARGKAIDAATIHNRRVQLNGISLTADTVLEVKADFDGFCPYCWEKIVKGHMDHIVPVSNGGTNARENLAWVCSTCNQQKGDKSLLEFRGFQENLAGAPL